MTFAEQVHQEGWLEGWLEGWHQGLLDGQRRLLLTVLEEKFGFISEEQAGRVERLDQAGLDAAAARFWNADSIDGVID